MKQLLILCIDLGSSSVRCSLYSMNGSNSNNVESVQPFHEASSLSWEAVHHETGKIRLQQQPNQQQQQQQQAMVPGIHENETVTLFDLVDQCIDTTLAKLQSTSSSGVEIVAVGFSSLVMNLIGVDAHGNPVGEEATLSYACNLSQVAAKVKELQGTLGPEELQHLYQKTGTPMHTAYALPQLNVFYQQHPEQARRVTQWQTLASLCLARWIQHDDSDDYKWPISYSEASWTGLMNTQSCQYEPSVLRLLPEACCLTLPPLADFDSFAVSDHTPSISLRPSYAARWPLLTVNTRFFLGVGDGACANVGSKCTTLDRMACTIGTSAAARVVVPAQQQQQQQQQSSSLSEVPAGLFCYRINHQYLLLGGALTDGGSVVAWIRELLNIQSDAEMHKCLQEVETLLRQDYEAATHQANDESTMNDTRRPLLIMLPFLSGERSTNFQTGATGAWVGLTRATTRARMVKSCLEGVTMRLAAITRLLPSRAQIWVSGKALEVNTVWRQMIADCTGRVVVLDPDTTEGSSRGVACLVAASLSGQGLIAEPAASLVETPPRSEGKAYWDKLIRAQERFVDAVRPIYAA